VVRELVGGARLKSKPFDHQISQCIRTEPASRAETIERTEFDLMNRRLHASDPGITFATSVGDPTKSSVCAGHASAPFGHSWSAIAWAPEMPCVIQHPVLGWMMS
jgi:hypothetical protein